MKIEVIPVTGADETTLRNLYQFYMYEFSRFMGWTPNYAGRFSEDDLDGCWTQLYRHPFLVRVDGELAGFAIVDKQDKSHRTGDDDIIEMAEFFIMGAFQGKGVGEYVATYLFDRFPGKWEVSELQKNVNAQRFWRKVIGQYTGEQYEEIVYGDADTIAQLFDSSRGK